MSWTERHGQARTSDGAAINWTTTGTPSLPVVLLHGGPGVPDYLDDVAAGFCLAHPEDTLSWFTDHVDAAETTR